jgi:hypothetical protein
MDHRDGKVGMLGGDRYAEPREFTAKAMDPRNAETSAVRDAMIAMRREAGLSDFPALPLYPDREAHFEPEPGQTLRPGMVTR